jgi:hypothetical protein
LLLKFNAIFVLLAGTGLAIVAHVALPRPDGRCQGKVNSNSAKLLTSRQ